MGELVRAGFEAKGLHTTSNQAYRSGNNEGVDGGIDVRGRVCAPSSNGIESGGKNVGQGGIDQTIDWGGACRMRWRCVKGWLEYGVEVERASQWDNRDVLTSE